MERWIWESRGHLGGRSVVGGGGGEVVARCRQLCLLDQICVCLPTAASMYRTLRADTAFYNHSSIVYNIRNEISIEK